MIFEYCDIVDFVQTSQDHVAYVVQGYLFLLFISERYLLVCKNKSLERFSVILLVAPVILFSLIYNLPRFFELQVEIDEYTNSTYVVPTLMRQHKHYIQIYIIWINLFVMGVIPFAILITLNICIFQKVRQLKLRRNRGENGEIVTPSLFYAKLCLFVVAVFVLSHTVRWIPNIWENYLVRITHCYKIEFFWKKNFLANFFALKIFFKKL